MPKRIKRLTIYKTDAEWLRDRGAVLEGLVKRDLIGIAANGTISVFPAAAAEEDLTQQERETIYHLLGYVAPDPDTPLIAKRPGVVGGRAAVAGTRISVWQIAGAVRHGVSRRELRMQMGLSDEQLTQALAYAEDHAEEIDRDLLDNEVAAQAKAGAWL